MSSFSQRSLTHLGMDVHKDSISVGILRPNKIACALLGLEPVVEERYGSTHKDYRAPLATAAGGAASLLRVALTIAFGIREERTRNRYWSDAEMVGPYLRFLQELGYQPTALEAAKLQRTEEGGR